MAALDVQPDGTDLANSEPNAEDLNDIEAAAGGYEELEDSDASFSSGFSGTKPPAF